MKPTGPEFPAFLAVKLTEQQARAVRRAARAERRTVSSYIRNVLIEATSRGLKQDEKSGDE